MLYYSDSVRIGLGVLHCDIETSHMVEIGADELLDLSGMSLDVRRARRDGGAEQLKRGMSTVCHAAHGRR